MTEGVVEKGFLDTIKDFLKPGVKKTTQNGSKWGKFKAKLTENFSKELIETGLGLAMIALWGATPIVALATFGLIVLGNASKDALEEHHKVFQEHHEVNNIPHLDIGE